MKKRITMCNLRDVLCLWQCVPIYAHYVSCHNDVVTKIKVIGTMQEPYTRYVRFNERGEA